MKRMVIMFQHLTEKRKKRIGPQQHINQRIVTEMQLGLKPMFYPAIIMRTNFTGSLCCRILRSKPALSVNLAKNLAKM